MENFKNPSVIFFVLIIADALLILTLLQSKLHPRAALWPPPKKFTWQYFYDWALNLTVLLGPVFLGILDWNSFILKSPLRFIPGVILGLTGLTLCEWGEKSLERFGHGELVTQGAYRYSRNPQYVGNIAFLLGYALCSNSRLTLISSILGSICFVIAPFCEEQKLKEKFGTSYEKYKYGRPRFIGFSKD